MATAYEDLVKHLKLVIRQLRELVTKTESSLEVGRHDQRSSCAAHRLGIPFTMKGSEVVAASKGILNTTTLRELDKDTCSTSLTTASSDAQHRSYHWIRVGSLRSQRFVYRFRAASVEHRREHIRSRSFTVPFLPQQGIT